jgi:hypothetical protein
MQPHEQTRSYCRAGSVLNPRILCRGPGGGDLRPRYAYDKRDGVCVFLSSEAGKHIGVGHCFF